MTLICYGAFKDCASLERITLPNSITGIGQEAFSGCRSLAVVEYGGTEEQKALIEIGENNDPLVNAEWHCTEPPVTTYALTLTDYTQGVQTPATVSGIVNGGEYSGLTSFTVSCDMTCLVLASRDGGATYERLTATPVEDGFSFTVDVDCAVQIAIVLVGDATLDGKVNTTDVTQIKRFIAGKREFNAIQLLAADVTGEGKLNTTDVTQLKRYIAGKRTFEW